MIIFHAKNLNDIDICSVIYNLMIYFLLLYNVYIKKYIKLGTDIFFALSTLLSNAPEINKLKMGEKL